MRRVASAAAVLILLAVPAAVHAQRLAFELRPGVAVPTARFARATLDPGMGVEGTLGVRLMPHVWAYAGWDWHRFTTSIPGTDATLDIDETGYAFGVRFQHPLRGSTGVALRLRGGGTWNHIEFEDAAGDRIGDSEHGLGWEVGAGLAVRLGDTWSLVPGIRYRSLDREYTLGTETGNGSLRYLALEVGFARGL